MCEFNEFAESIIPQEVKVATHFKLLLFFTERELGESDDYNKWVCTREVEFNDYHSAMNAYANTRCPASQLIEASSKSELDQKVQEMKDNYNNIEWLEKNLYPFL